MAFWLIVGFIILTAGIYFLIIALKDEFDWSDIAMIIATILIAVGVIAPICVADTRINYNQFENSFELQRELYNGIQENDNWHPDIYNVVDIMTANKELCDYQARRKMYGYFSIIPERVLDIEPIGLD